MQINHSFIQSINQSVNLFVSGKAHSTKSRKKSTKINKKKNN